MPPMPCAENEEFIMQFRMSMYYLSFDCEWLWYVEALFLPNQGDSQ